jgi:hypothetical protein
MPHIIGGYVYNLIHVQASLRDARLDPNAIEDICVGKFRSSALLLISEYQMLGTCHPPSPLYLSRAAVLAAGIPHTVPISTVIKFLFPLISMQLNLQPLS